MRRSLLLFPLMLLAAPLAAQVASGDAVKWSPAPPFFPAGAKFAVIQGDPASAGEYTVRLLPPLVSTKEDIGRGLEILEGILE